MNLITNGFPKSGVHALVKACELLGVPGRVEHLRAGELPSGTTHHVFIKRDPRNVIVSWLRMNRRPMTPGTFLAAFRRFQTASLVDELEAFEPWLSDPNTFVVSYEALIRSDWMMREIAHYLGTHYFDGAWLDLPGHTMTWNAVRSDYFAIWNPHVDRAWNAEGGPELLERWGY